MNRELIQESVLFHLWLALSHAWRESGLHRLVERAGTWCTEQVDGSRLLSRLGRGGALSDAWAESRMCRILTAVTTFPGRLLHRWYAAWEATFQDSFFADLVFDFGEHTAVAESWLIMALWVIPFVYWDNAYSLGAFAFLLLLFHAGAMRRRSFALDLRDIGFYPVLFFLSITLGLVLSYDPALSVRFYLYHLAAALCLLVTVSAVRNAGDLKRLCAGAAFVVGVSGGYGILQRIQGVKVNIAYVDAKLNPDMPGRVQSYFDNPNTFGEVLVMLLPLALALAVCSRRKLGRAAAAFLWLVGAAALVMTYSRAGYLGLALSVAVTVYLLRPSLIPALLALCVAAIPFLPSAVWTRILTIGNFNDTTTSSRFPLYEAALNVLKQSPVTGAGLGSDVVRQYIKDFRLYHGSAPFVHAHNFYLQIWLETGLLGIVSFLAAMYWAVRRGITTVRRTPPSPERTILCCASAGLCGIALCGMADFPWHYPRLMCVFWYLFAVALAGVKVCAASAETAAPSVTRKPVPAQSAPTGKRRAGQKRRRKGRR